MEDMGLVLLSIVVIGFMGAAHTFFSIAYLVAVPFVILAIVLIILRPSAKDSLQASGYKVTIPLAVFGLALFFAGLLEQTSKNNSDNGVLDNLAFWKHVTLGSIIQFLGAGLFIMGCIGIIFVWISIEDEQEQNLRLRIFGKWATILFICFIIGVAIRYTVVKLDNSKQLQVYQKELIGNTYYDIEQEHYQLGDNVTIGYIEFIDEENLGYGTFDIRLSSKKNAFDRKKEQDSATIFSYRLKINLKGEVSVRFGGKTYDSVYDVINKEITSFILF